MELVFDAQSVATTHPHQRHKGGAEVFVWPPGAGRATARS